MATKALERPQRYRKGQEPWTRRIQAWKSLSPQQWLDWLGLTREEARERCKRDLYFLATQVCQYTYYYAPLHKPLCLKYEERELLSLWLVPRDHLKSTTFTVTGSIQEVLQDPNITILITSAKMENSLAFMKDIRDHFLYNERLLFLFPEYRIEPGKEGRLAAWSVAARDPMAEAREHTFTASGVDASVVSKHFDIIKCDDLVNDQNVRSAEGMNRVKDHFRNMWPLIRPGTGIMVVIGTRWDQSDAYGMIIEEMEEEGASKVIRSAEEKNPRTGKNEAIYPETDWGQPMYDLFVLRSKRRKMKEYFYSCQYLNAPIPDRENRIMHPDQIQWIKQIPSGCHYFVFCDPGISAREEADRSALICVALDWMKNLYVVDCIAGHLAPSVLAQWMFEFGQTHHPRFIMMETLAFQDVYRMHLETLIQQHGANVTIHEALRKGNEEKVRRIFGPQPWFEQRKIFFLRGGRGVQDVVDECSVYTKKLSKRQRDDIVDALSDAVVHGYAPARPVGQFATGTVPEHFARLDAATGMAAFGASGEEAYVTPHLEGFG